MAMVAVVVVALVAVVAVSQGPVTITAISVMAVVAAMAAVVVVMMMSVVEVAAVGVMLQGPALITRPDSKWRGIHVAQPMQKSFPEIWSKVYLPSFRMIWEGTPHTVTAPPPPQGMGHELLDSNLGLH